jgi:hypothetical protein
MLKEACKFWGIKNHHEYTLVPSNMHDVMRLNSDPEHIAHTISKYFEINQSKNAVLHLVKPDKKRT